MHPRGKLVSGKILDELFRLAAHLRQRRLPLERDVVGRA
jgi:hypothetical protein